MKISRYIKKFTIGDKRSPDKQKEIAELNHEYERKTNEKGCSTREVGLLKLEHLVSPNKFCIKTSEARIKAIEYHNLIKEIIPNLQLIFGKDSRPIEKQLTTNIISGQYWNELHIIEGSIEKEFDSIAEILKRDQMQQVEVTGDIIIGQ